MHFVLGTMVLALQKFVLDAYGVGIRSDSRDDSTSHLLLASGFTPAVILLAGDPANVHCGLDQDLIKASFMP